MYSLMQKRKTIAIPDSMDVRIFSVFFRVSILLLLLAVTGGCATYGSVIFKDETGSVAVEIDKGPGQQPPPGDCWELERQVPPGAWLI